jgi:NAD(P)-dependent dehydrogenase (short-subunit alcohol dehydrogenase family)
MDRLAGRVVFVTGSTGIAAATAVRADAEGASVFVVSRSEEHARTLAERLERGAWAAADLTDEAAVDAAVAAASERFGRLDALFSAAGGSGRRFGDGPVHELRAEAWEATAALNLRTQVLVCARVVRAMRGQEPDASGIRGSVLILGAASPPAHRSPNCSGRTATPPRKGP